MSLPIITTKRLADLTTLKVGGEALVTEVSTEAELVAALNWSKAKNLGYRILGGGSNILVSDAGLSELVIKMSVKGRTVIESADQILLTVGAGEVFDEVVADAVANGWWGLENLSHIPGSVGATPVQNVGAYGVEVKDVIEKVTVLNAADHSLRELSAADCQFGYRDSIFKHEAGRDLIVLSVTFRLNKQPCPVLHYRDLTEAFSVGSVDQLAIRNKVIEIRSAKFPDWHKVGTAGSFFKNPIIPRQQFAVVKDQYPDLPMYEVDADNVKVPLGFILDKILNLKGVREGNVGNYEGQALVLVNYGTDASEVSDYADAVAEKVFAVTGIKIEREVTTW